MAPGIRLHEIDELGLAFERQLFQEAEQRGNLGAVGADQGVVNLALLDRAPGFHQPFAIGLLLVEASLRATIGGPLPRFDRRADLLVGDVEKEVGGHGVKFASFA